MPTPTKSSRTFSAHSLRSSNDDASPPLPSAVRTMRDTLRDESAQDVRTLSNGGTAGRRAAPSPAVAVGEGRSKTSLAVRGQLGRGRRTQLYESTVGPRLSRLIDYRVVIGPEGMLGNQLPLRRQPPATLPQSSTGRVRWSRTLGQDGASDYGFRAFFAILSFQAIGTATESTGFIVLNSSTWGD